MTVQTKIPAFKMCGLLSVIVLTGSVLLTCQQLAGPPCLIRRACHIPCPGCGLTRSFDAIWHGDVSASVHYHPLGLPLFLLLAMCAGAWALSGWLPPARRLSERLEKGMVQPRAWFLLLALWLGIWIARLIWAQALYGKFWW